MGPSLYKRGFDDDIEVLKAKLGETTLLLEVLAYVNSLLSQERSFEDFCIEVEKTLKEKLKFKVIHIWIRDEKDPSQLKLVTPESANGYRSLGINQGIVGKCIREAKSIYVADVNSDPDYIKYHPDTKSELCIPLIADREVIGALNIETDVFQQFAGQIAIIEIIAANLSNSLKLALLNKTKEQYHGLIETMAEGVWVGDKEWKTIFVNSTMGKILKYSKEQILGKSAFDFTDSEGKIILKKEFERRKIGMPGHYEVTFIASDGKQIPVLIHSVPFGNGGSMATITDLRALKKTQEKLIHTERFLASVVQYCAEAIVGLDENGIVQSWNVGAEQMFGYKPDEIIGKSIEIIIPEELKSTKALQQILQETKTRGFVRNVETTRIHKNGKPISVCLSWNAVKDNFGKLIGISAIYRDITTQKKWERELQDRFEKMQDAYREMGKQRRYLDYLMDIISMSASSGVSMRQLATFVVNAMVVITKVDAATIRLMDRPSGKLILTAHSGVSEDWSSKKAIPYSGSIVEAAIKTGHPMKILDILSDPRYTSPSLARKNNLRSALIIPLAAKGEVLGSISLYLSQEGNLSLLDDEFIMIFAKQTAVAFKLISASN